MAYFLSPIIDTNTEGQWFEGNAYEKDTLYSIEEGKLPPVNYDKHSLKPHSLTHAEAPRHVDNNGASIDTFFEGSFFYGRCAVLRLRGNNFKPLGNGCFHWEVQVNELEEALVRLFVDVTKFPNKILVTVDQYPTHKSGYHNPSYVLTLTQNAADYLISIPQFHLYGTSWKSTDYAPGSLERPIHKTIFKKAVIFENLDLKDVPEGVYFFSAPPIRLLNASESPVCPVLYTKEELLDAF